MDWLDYDMRQAAEKNRLALEDINAKINSRGLKEKLERDGVLYASDILDVINEVLDLYR